MKELFRMGGEPPIWDCPEGFGYGLGKVIQNPNRFMNKDVDQLANSIIP